MRPPNLIRTRNRRKGEPWNSKYFLKKGFTENIPLKLFAIVMAVVMWGLVATDRRGETTGLQFSASLVFKNIPPNMEVVGAPERTVGLLAGLQRSMGGSVNPSFFQVLVNLEGYTAGPTQYVLREEQIRYNNQAIPRGMKIYQITPRVLSFSLEETIEKEVTIRPRYSGDTAKGYTIGSIRIEPPIATVRGAKSQLEKLDRVYTLPLDIRELKNDVEMLVRLDLTPDLRPAKSGVFYQAFIKVTQNVSRLLIREIPVVTENARHVFRISTKTVNVFLEGPEEIMLNLNKSNVFAVLDLSKYPPGDYREQSPRVMVPETVKVLEQWPIIDLLVLNRRSKKSG